MVIKTVSFSWLRYRLRRLLMSLLLLAYATLAWSDNSDILRVLQGQAHYYYQTDRYHDALASIAQWHTINNSSTNMAHTEPWAMNLLEASILLAMGLEQKAEAIMIDAQIARINQLGDAWFLLSRRWQQQGDWERAQKTAELALASRNQLSSEWRSEAQFILALAYAQQLNMSAVATVVNAMPVRDIWTAYARYNWVLALIESYTPSHQIQQIIAETLHYMGDNDEFRQLRQRLLLVASIEALEANNPRLAEQYLTQITQDSPYAAVALLQYSWTSLAQQQWTQALHSLRALQQQHHEFHPAVMESFLLVPYALEKMNAQNQAVRAYQQVERRLVSMRQQVEQARQQITSGDWLQQWLQDLGHESSWGWQQAPVSIAKDGDVSRLLHGLIEQNAFEVALQDMVDLQYAQQQVHQQLHDIPLWQANIARRQQHAQSVQGEAVMQRLQRRFDAVHVQVETQQTNLQQQAREAFSYTTAAEQDALQLQQTILRRIQVLQQRGHLQGVALSDYQERWRRLRGLQLWQNNETLPERRWQAVQALQAMQQAMSQLEQQRRHSEIALRWMQGDWQNLSQRLSQQQQLGIDLLQQLGHLQQRQQQHIQQWADQHLQALDQRLLDYLSQTRLAIARLYDDALQQQLERQQEEVDQNA